MARSIRSTSTPIRSAEDAAKALRKLIDDGALSSAERAEVEGVLGWIERDGTDGERAQEHLSAVRSLHEEWMRETAIAAQLRRTGASSPVATCARRRETTAFSRLRSAIRHGPGRPPRPMPSGLSRPETAGRERQSRRQPIRQQQP